VTAIDRTYVAKLLAAGDSAPTMAARGRALEDLIIYVFELVPGIILTQRNKLNAFEAEEIDVAFWKRATPQDSACSTTSCWSNARTGPRAPGIRSLRCSMTSSGAAVGRWASSSLRPASPETRRHVPQRMGSSMRPCARAERSS
jgi:hypothetical protein